MDRRKTWTREQKMYLPQFHIARIFHVCLHDENPVLYMETENRCAHASLNQTSSFCLLYLN